MIDYFDHGVVWYAMKTVYKKELQAKAYLDAHGIECFIPMEQQVSTKSGRKTTILKPAIHNLIFVKADLAQLNDIKISLNYLHNRLTTEEDRSIPIIVPTVQMDQFIRAIKYSMDKISYIDLSKSFMEKGVLVRITDGDFKGYEGVLTKIKSRRDRRVTISIEGLIAYSIDVDANFIEKV